MLHGCGALAALLVAGCDVVAYQRSPSYILIFDRHASDSSLPAHEFIQDAAANPPSFLHAHERRSVTKNFVAGKNPELLPVNRVHNDP